MLHYWLKLSDWINRKLKGTNLVEHFLSCVYNNGDIYHWLKKYLSFFVEDDILGVLASRLILLMCFYSYLKWSSVSCAKTYLRLLWKWPISQRTVWCIRDGSLKRRNRASWVSFACLWWMYIACVLFDDHFEFIRAVVAIVRRIVVE